MRENMRNFDIEGMHAWSILTPPPVGIDSVAKFRASRAAGLAAAVSRPARSNPAPSEAAPQRYGVLRLEG